MWGAFRNCNFFFIDVVVLVGTSFWGCNYVLKSDLYMKTIKNLIKILIKSNT